MNNTHIIILLWSAMILVTGCDSNRKTSTSDLVNEESTKVSYEKAAISGYKNLSPIAFKEAFDQDTQAILIDVRTPKEIAKGKVVGAIEYNYSNAGFGETILNLDKSKHYYLYCATGLRSGKTARMMVENGFKNVTNMDGSLEDLLDE